jgi:hypothetical protein
MNITDIFGYHSVNDGIDANERKGIKVLNKMNKLSYIPIVCSIIGCARIDLATRMIGSQNPNTRKLGYAELSRGTFELTSCGFLLAIPDLVFTMNRKLCRLNLPLRTQIKIIFIAS